jgi:hypothetical protein
MKKGKPKSREQSRRKGPRPVEARVVQLDIHREIRHITQLGQSEDARIVRLGNLLLFSTWSRDAWLLDIEDHLALCLCRDGDPQPFRIADSPSTLAIEWTSSFEIDNALFVVEEPSGRIVAIHGYPVSEIAAHLGNA